MLPVRGGSRKVIGLSSENSATPLRQWYAVLPSFFTAPESLRGAEDLGRLGKGSIHTAMGLGGGWGVIHASAHHAGRAL